MFLLLKTSLWLLVLASFGYRSGLRTPNEAFFHQNLKLLGLGRFFGVFSVGLSEPILVLWVLCPYFPLINHYSYKKLSLYIQIPNIYFWLEYELGPHTKKEFSHHVSIVRAIKINKTYNLKSNQFRFWIPTVSKILQRAK